MIPLLLFNTLERRKVPFTPIVPGVVGLYSCGPTVYSFAHLGNLRALLFSDTLRRVLEYRGLTVTQVMNITDVGHLTDDADAGEDKIERGARREGKTAYDVAAFYTEAFLRDLERLNVEQPTAMPRATEHIAEQIALIEQLEQKGFTYVTTDGVYFDTAKLPDYGKLARLDRQQLEAGARVELNPEKRHPQDFALWKFSPTDEQRQMEWPSPWGTGFPGWHIECSAMSVKYLGQPFDIHMGGIEHIPVHHTNEIAQSEAATNKTLANYWLHNEHLLFAGGKMAKSDGTLVRLEDVVERGIDPLAFRYLALGTQYRHPLNFTWEALDAAANGLRNLRDQIARLNGEPSTVPTELNDEFVRAISDDLNTPQALALLHDVLGSDRPDGEKLAAAATWDAVFGLKLLDQRSVTVPPAITEQHAAYETARRAKDFGTSDRLRAELLAAGYIVEDLADGTSRLISR